MFASPPLDNTLSLMNPVHTLISYLFSFRGLCRWSWGKPWNISENAGPAAAISFWEFPVCRRDANLNATTFCGTRTLWHLIYYDVEHRPSVGRLRNISWHTAAWILPGRVNGAKSIQLHTHNNFFVYMRVFENRVLRRMFPAGGEVVRAWRRAA
jgi:hypothetical protein